ncbi:MAG: family 78 glycoside hydrolase catalytic domain [Lachnospiraceae bacterium]|nr:family 78 glycoside hydrolase catalytic domain [Lachnospiraceae bacterium]
MFENIRFMKPPITLAKEFTGKNHAPLFRKKFQLDEVKNARLYVCGLGYGYYYINGRPVSEDLFTAPVSNYTKTLWYNTYDVTGLLIPGENCIAVWCGNGWYNEDFPNAWDFDKAVWRDVPKCILKLEVDGVTALTSDDTWKCQPDSAIWFNGLRNGEFFDARKYDGDWTKADYDDSLWTEAAADDNPPKGIFRECKCEPIREEKVYACQKVIKTGEQKYVFDFGQNMSGYIRLHIAGKEGQLLTIRYAEQLKADGSRELNNMARVYPESEFQTDKFICSGKRMTWSPRFAYHGFRYIEIEGLKNREEAVVEAVFVHQAVEKRTEFECSNSFLNQLFYAGQMSTYSNMFYQITDCPTREKLGWANDAQASAEQILTDFKAERLLEKWLQDIRDAMREDGALPGIMPTAGWGYHWGNGPVSDGVLFELPYRIYLHTGNALPLAESWEWFDRYLAFLDSIRDADGFVRYGLPDWARPGLKPPLVPGEMINAVLEYRFCEIAALTVRLSGDTASAQEGITAGTGGQDHA